MSVPVIQTSSLSRRFGEKNAVAHLTLDVQAGEIFGFLGHNGAGKTTTVRLLNGVLKPTSGQVCVLGLDLQTEGPAVLVLWVTPAVAGLGLVVMVFVSARAQGFQDTYQTGELVVLPVLALMIGQISGVIYFSLGVVLLVGLVIWLLDIVLLRFASKSFRRGELITKF